MLVFERKLSGAPHKKADLGQAQDRHAVHEFQALQGVIAQAYWAVQAGSEPRGRLWAKDTGRGLGVFRSIVSVAASGFRVRRSRFVGRRLETIGTPGVGRVVLGLNTRLKGFLGPLNLLPALDASFASVMPGAIIVVAPSQGRRSSAEDEGRRESNLGLGEHFVSPVRLID
jgi:hypothetical protein